MSERSQDEDTRPRAVQNGMPQEEYDVWMWAAVKYLDGSDPYTIKAPLSEVVKLLRQRNDAAVRAALEDVQQALESCKSMFDVGILQGTIAMKLQEPEELETIAPSLIAKMAQQDMATGHGELLIERAIELVPPERLDDVILTDTRPDYTASGAFIDKSIPPVYCGDDCPGDTCPNH